jgi:hypothetical protein
MRKFTIWLILKFWPNKFMNLLVTHYPNFLCSGHFENFAQSHRILFSIFRKFKFLAYDLQCDYILFIKRFDSS